MTLLVKKRVFGINGEYYSEVISTYVTANMNILNNLTPSSVFPFLLLQCDSCNHCTRLSSYEKSLKARKSSKRKEWFSHGQIVISMTDHRLICSRDIPFHILIRQVRVPCKPRTKL